MKSILLYCTHLFHLVYCYTTGKASSLLSNVACRWLLADVHVVTTLDDIDIHAYLDE